MRPGVREQETGVAQVQRSMQQAERDHARFRRMTMIAVGLTAAVLVLVVGGLTVFGNRTESTSALGAVATVASASSATAQAPKVPVSKPAPADKAPQHYTIKIGAAGYEPSTLQASSRSPITLTVGKGEGCAAGFLIPSLGIDEDNSRGDVTFSLGTLKPGVYRFSCAMEMVQGQLTVK